MVEIEDIVDRESLREWLEGQPQHLSVVVAHRAAMRVLTSHWLWMLRAEEARENKLTALPVLMRSLILGVIAFGENSENEVKVDFVAAESSIIAANNAIQAAVEALKDKRSPNAILNSFYAFAAYSAASTYSSYAAANLSNRFVVRNAVNSVGSAAEITRPTADLWGYVRSDCALITRKTDLDTIPLWDDQILVPSREWMQVKSALNESEEDWSFWVRWYDGALLGEPLNWNLQKRIALELTEVDWSLGPEHVNKKIAEIEAEFVVDALPQVDRMDVDPDTGRVEITPILTTEEAIVATSLKQVEFSYSVAKNSNCGLNFNSVACLYLEQTFENCRDDPNAILQNYQIALGDILDGLKNGAYLDDAKLTALSTVLEKEIVNLLANHPEVKKADRARIAHALSLAKSDVKLKIVKELEFPKAAAGLRLGAEMSLDINLVAQEGESPAQAKAAQRLFGRIAQMYVTMKNASVAMVKKIDAATGYKFVRIVATLGKIVGWIASLFS